MRLAPKTAKGTVTITTIIVSLCACGESMVFGESMVAFFVELVDLKTLFGNAGMGSETCTSGWKKSPDKAWLPRPWSLRAASFYASTCVFARALFHSMIVNKKRLVLCRPVGLKVPTNQ